MIADPSGTQSPDLRSCLVTRQLNWPGTSCQTISKLNHPTGRLHGSVIHPLIANPALWAAQRGKIVLTSHYGLKSSGSFMVAQHSFLIKEAHPPLPLLEAPQATHSEPVFFAFSRQYSCFFFTRDSWFRLTLRIASSSLFRRLRCGADET
jgi:hypothetical protein